MRPGQRPAVLHFGAVCGGLPSRRERQSIPDRALARRRRGERRNDHGKRQTRCGSSVHRHRGPFPERQDLPPRSHPRAHRNDRARRARQHRQHGRRFERRGPRPRDERRAEFRDLQVPRRDLHLRRLPGLGRVRARHAHRDAGLRRRGRGLRGGRPQDPGARARAARARGGRHPALPVHQQDRRREPARPRDAGAPPEGVADAAAPAPDPDLEGRHRRRLHRPRARARLRLPRARPERGGRAPGRRAAAREGGALLDARASRRPRRRADGGPDLRDRAAEGPRLRGSGEGAARAPGRAGDDRLGRARQRRHPTAQGAAPRGAARSPTPAAGSASPIQARRSPRS